MVGCLTVSKVSKPFDLGPDSLHGPDARIFNGNFTTAGGMRAVVIIMWDHLPRRSYAVSSAASLCYLLGYVCSISTTLARFLITLNWFDRSPPTYDINSIF